MATFSFFAGLKTSTRWALVQLLQQVEPACIDPLLVIFYISPSSAISMTPMALLDILDEDLRGAHLTPASIGQVVGLILVTGMFSFMLIFAEVRGPNRQIGLGGAGVDIGRSVERRHRCALQKRARMRACVGGRRARRNLAVVRGGHDLLIPDPWEKKKKTFHYHG